MSAPFAIPAPRRLRLGDVLRPVVDKLYGLGIGDDYSRRCLRKLTMCGTGELGTCWQVCGDCDAREALGMTCQNRHCPSCGQEKAAKWVEARGSELVEAPYFHYVFTVPGKLYPLFLSNRRVLYDLFQRVVRELILAFAADPKFLGGTPWAMSVLHTTNQQLGYHPHIHVLLAGVGWNEKDNKFVRCPKDSFLFPARALAAGIRGRFLAGVRGLLNGDELVSPDGSDWTADTKSSMLSIVSSLHEVNWQVRTKRAYGGAEQTVRYLARYVERTAISNGRLVKMGDDKVTFSYTNRRLGKRQQMELSLLEFARRFERHILPKGFVRVRRFGLLSTHKRLHLLPRVQAAAAIAAGKRGWLPPSPTLDREGKGSGRCSCCGSSNLRFEGMNFSAAIPLTLGKGGRAPPPSALPWPMVAAK